MRRRGIVAPNGAATRIPVLNPALGACTAAGTQTQCQSLTSSALRLCSATIPWIGVKAWLTVNAQRACGDAGAVILCKDEILDPSDNTVFLVNLRKKKAFLRRYEAQELPSEQISLETVL